MTRQEHYNNIKELFNRSNSLMLKLPTSFGKTRIAIDLIKEHETKAVDTLFELEPTVLIVVPRLVLFDTWKAELEKWEFPKEYKVQFTTYVSFPKYVDRFWNFIVFDEGHHFTENCADAFISARYEKVIFMSATFPKQQRFRIKSTIRGIEEYVVTARDAINDEILPDPKVILVPLVLDNTRSDEVFIKNAKRSGEPIKCFYKDRFEIQKQYKYRPLHIYCTQQQYYNELNYIIDFWKQGYISSRMPYQKNLWLRKAKDRLDWLAEKKEVFVKKVLNVLDNYRTLTFCTSIAQTERLGANPINSKNENSQKNLESFNSGKIKHITAVGMLNEGVNLSQCQIGIYSNIGSSEVIEIQRLGRILRHTNPLIVIPFFVGTREQEIVEKMSATYNKKLTFTVFPSEFTTKRIEGILNENSN